MRNVLFAAAVAATLTGCVTFGDLDRGLQSLVGQPLDRAVDVLGYPTTQLQVAGDTVYVWSVDRRGTLLMPQTTTMNGYVGTTPVGGSATTMQAVPMHGDCTIKLGVGADNVVKRYDWEGNHMGCDSYAMRVKRALGQ